ncbi:MAG: DUF393 domain-containing protein [Verrucomicrobiales bacterium]|nr:MAG: DUF393 domain-containing protein [Verrucomicrobiales bacterium]
MGIQRDYDAKPPTPGQAKSPSGAEKQRAGWLNIAPAIIFACLNTTDEATICTAYQSSMKLPSANKTRVRWLSVRANASGLVLYDGVCGMCDRTVQFLLKNDVTRTLKFAALQGDTARQRADLPNDLKSVAFVANHGTTQEQIYFRSEAVLRMLDQIGGFWRVVSWLRVVPRPVRDAIYDAIAKRRYQWFGKFDACHIPSPELRDRFLP